MENADPAWQPLRTIPTLTDSPLALVVWLRRSRGAQLLRDLIATGRPPSHTDIGTGQAEHYLRSLLIITSILEPRNEPLERLDPWIDALVADDPPDIQQVLQQFAQWHVMRRARQRSTRRELTESSGKWARQQIAVARDFMLWLSHRDTTLDACRQPDLDLWLASGNTRRTVIRDFIAWTQQRGYTTTELTVPLRNTIDPSAPLDEPERARLLRRMLTDHEVPDEIRIAGALVLVYGQHLSRIARLRPASVTLGEHICHITIAKTPLPLPADLAAPLRRLLSTQPRGKASVARQKAPEQWLFPGGNPGQHIHPETLRTRLAAHGIELRRSRHAALIQWAHDTPAPVMAEALGLHVNTAVAWRDAIQADYTDYIATRM